MIRKMNIIRLLAEIGVKGGNIKEDISFSQISRLVAFANPQAINYIIINIFRV